jgi:hypothetical protein
MTSLSLPLRILGIAAFAALVIVASTYRGGATGYTFSTGDFNLKIDSNATYNGVLQPGSTWALKNLVPGSDKFFNFSDVKPGDTGTTTISIHVNKDAWVCLDFENLKQKENGRNEPELLEDNSGGANSGELAAGTEFFAWYDDGDNKYEVGELPVFGTSTPQSALQLFNNATYAVADAVAGSAIPANQTKYIGITFCAGNLTVNTTLAKVTCDGKVLGNAAQTDSFSVDIGLRAVPKKDNKNFTCKKQGNSCSWGGCNTGSCKVTVKIDNNGTIISNTSSNSNTGGNSAGSGGTVVTGNATSNSSSTNILNIVRILFGR